MNQRADGSRALHRVGQPNVQWKLSALSTSAEHQQQANRQTDTARDVSSSATRKSYLSQHSRDIADAS